jgi:hypothetical protein
LNNASDSAEEKWISFVDDFIAEVAIRYFVNALKMEGLLGPMNVSVISVRNSLA